MRMRALRVLLTVACLAGMARSGLAVDAVYRKSNPTPAQGEVTNVSRTEITVKPRIGDTVTVPISDITRVRWDGEPAILNLSRSSEQSGYFDKAIEGYEKAAAEYTGSSKYLRDDIVFLIARASARAALADPTRLDDAVTKLEAFTTGNGQNFRYFEALHYLGQLYLSREDFAKAKEAFDEMEKAPLRAFQMTARVANARVLFSEGKTGEAMSLFSTVAGEDASDPTEVAAKYEAMLGKAACQHKGSQFDQAIQTLEEVIGQVSPQETALMAEAYLRQGDCYRDQNRIKEAVLAYLHVDVLFPNEKALHPEALYQLARLWAAAGHPERGAEAEGRLTEEYPKNEWTQKLSGTN